MKKSKSKNLSLEQIHALLDMAKKTRNFAFSHRSMHKIWASVLTADGEIFGGCNIESVISGLWTCAERCAVDNAVAHGYYDIIAVCTIDSAFTPTCGACLQYILLFSQVSNKEIVLINGDTKGNYEIKTLSELLPEWYKTQSNLKAIRSYSKIKLNRSSWD
jgi:cytidine deaminase